MSISPWVRVHVFLSPFYLITEIAFYFAISFCCFQAGLYEGAVHLDELNILLSRRYVCSVCMYTWHTGWWDRLSDGLPCVSIQLSWILGGAAPGRKSRENSAGKGALGVPVQGIYGCLKSPFFFPVADISYLAWSVSDVFLCLHLVSLRLQGCVCALEQ